VTVSSSSSSPPTAPWSGETAVLDLRGEVCPYTFVRTRLKLEDMPIGSSLWVLIDHEPASRQLPASAAEWGQEVREVRASGSMWEILLIRRT
jgi:tRNA 2-thiouridine synthesizing protein A